MRIHFGECFLLDSLKIVKNDMTNKQDENTLVFDQSFCAQDVHVPSSLHSCTVNMAQLPVASRVETSFQQEAAAETSDIHCENSEVDLFEEKHNGS